MPARRETRSSTMADDPAHCWDDMTELDDQEEVDEDVAD